MLIDTHCHINMMIKKQFDTQLPATYISSTQKIIDESEAENVTTIINVGTSLIESNNCIILAKQFKAIWATVGLHPNDCTPTWRSDLKELELLLKNKKENKIVGIGECGLDFHYPNYDIKRQKDAFKAQIELALEHDLALVVHTRDAHDETLRSLEEFAGQIYRGVMHCFSEDQPFADQVIAWNFVLGIGGTVSYPKNDILRSITKTVPLSKIVLETDAPFLPPQQLRGTQNHPKNIALIAHYIAELREESFDQVADTTSINSLQLFNIHQE